MRQIEEPPAFVKCLLADTRHGGDMGKKMVEETLREIEQTQLALRQSIEQTKQLAEKSEQLISTHRKELRETEH